MTSKNIDRTLEELQKAIKSGDYATAESTLGELTTLYDSVETDEMVRVHQVRGAINNEPLSTEQINIAHQYLGQKVATNLARTAVLTGGKMYLLDPYNSDKSDVIEGVHELVGHESKLQDYKTSIENEFSDIELSQSAHIIDISQPDKQLVVGGSAVIDVTIQNVGDKATSDIKVKCTTDLNVTPSSVELGKLDAQEETTASFELEGGDGEYDVEFIVESDDVGSDLRKIVLPVVSKQNSARMSTESIDEIIDLVTNNGSLEEGWITALLASLENAAVKVDDALQYMDEEGTWVDDDNDFPGRGPLDRDGHPGRGPRNGKDQLDGISNEEKVNNALTAAINQLGAFLNKVSDFQDNSDEADISVGFWFTLQKYAERTIDQLARARRASMDGHDLDSGSSDDDERGEGPPDDDERGEGPPDDGERGEGPPDDGERGEGPPDDES